jgi:hypothetical protein
MKKELRYSFLFLTFFLLFLDALQAQVIFKVESPESVAKLYEISESSGWGADLNNPDNAITGKVVLIRDKPNSQFGDSLGCDADPYLNASEIAGNIAIIYRGQCEFGAKALKAQNAGAIGVIIINGGPANPGPEDLLSMGAGAVGGEVNIPVVMISKNSGSILRSAIDAGELIVFIGSKVGLLTDDLALMKNMLLLPKNTAMPAALATNGDDFNFPVGSWVRNFGSSNQAAVKLKVEVINELGSVFFSRITDGIELNSGDSILIDAGLFKLESYPIGLYRLIYTVLSNEVDLDPSDNTFQTNFWINESIFSRHQFNDDKEPITPAFYKFTETPAITGCIYLNHPSLDKVVMTGISAAASGSAAAFDGQFIEFIGYEIINNDTTLFFPGLYEFQDSTESGKFVTKNFFYNFKNTAEYIICAKVDHPDIFLGFEPDLKYNFTENTIGENLYVLLHPTGWTQFTNDFSPAIMVHTTFNTSIEKQKENISKNKIVPYPNPASNVVHIPLGKSINGDAVVSVFDFGGKSVKAQTIRMDNTNLLIFNTDGIENGLYYFQLSINNESTSFKVLINK